MRKLFLLSFAAALSLTASAEMTHKKLDGPHLSALKKYHPTEKLTATTPASKPRHAKLSNDMEVKDVAGRYTLNYKDGNGASASVPLYITVQNEASGAIDVAFDIPGYGRCDLNQSVFDPESKTIYVPVTRGNYDPTFEGLYWFMAVGRSVDAAGRVTYTPDGLVWELRYDSTVEGGAFVSDQAWGVIGRGLSGTIQPNFEFVHEGAVVVPDAESGSTSEVASLAGNYDLLFLDAYSGGTPCMIDAQLYVTDEATNSVELSFVQPDNGALQLKGTYDPVKKTLTFPYFRGYYNPSWEEYVSFVTCLRLNPDNEYDLTRTRDPLVLTWDPDLYNGSFHSDQIFCQVGETAAGEFTKGYYFISETATLRKVREWRDAGMAYFTEGSAIMPFFDLKMENQKLPIEQSPYDDNIYRLVNPWNAPFNMNLYSNLEFDVSDPDCVVIPLQTTNLKENTHGTAYVESASADYLSAGYTKEEFLAEAPERNIVLRDGRIDLPIGSFFAIYDGDWQSCYWMTAENGGTPGYILMPGYVPNSIEALSSDNCEPEYFNLQGIRVANPGTGIYIVRRGSSANIMYIK